VTDDFYFIKRQTGRRLREAKMGEFHGLAQWPEILADAGG